MNKKELMVAIFILSMLISLTGAGGHVNLAKAQSPDTQTMIIYNPTQNATYVNNMKVSFSSSFYNGTKGLDGWFMIDNNFTGSVRSDGIDGENYTHFEDTFGFTYLNLGNGTTHQMIVGVSVELFDGRSITHVNESSAPIPFTVSIIPPTFQINSPQNKTYNTADITLDVTLTDPSSFPSSHYLLPPYYDYSLDKRPFDIPSEGVEYFTNLTNGSHSILVSAFDKNETVFFTINAQPTPTPMPSPTLTPSPSVPEFPTWIVPPIFLVTAFAVAAFTRRKEPYRSIL